MKVVILAGGFGTRISEETSLIPKPMIEIGGHPILWHLMKLYSHHGFDEFVICLGYKGQIIKDYFHDYFIRNSDVTFNIGANNVEFHNSPDEHWKVTLVDTGAETQTGGRIRRIAPYIRGEKNFALTYGDGLANVDLKALVDFHEQHGKLATVTAVLPPSRFGVLELSGDRVTAFKEKPLEDSGKISGGFFVLSSEVLDYIPESDDAVWENEPLASLASEGELHAYVHDGFWQPMDTLRDKRHLNSLWDSGKPPWRVWP